MTFDQPAVCYILALESINAGYFESGASTKSYGMFSRVYSRAPSDSLHGTQEAKQQPSVAAILTSKSTKYVKSKKVGADLKQGRTLTSKPTGRAAPTVSKLFSSRFSTFQPTG